MLFSLTLFFSPALLSRLFPFHFKIYEGDQKQSTLLLSGAEDEDVGMRLSRGQETCSIEEDLQ